MKKYLFLSSALVMTMTGAFGADKIITSANTCTVDVLGVSDNNATANTIATWDLIDYTLNPGQYLNVTETSVDKTTCPAGSYCVGGGFTVETAGNSIAQCPTGYPNSANGASADTQCYTACTLASANIAHATAVTGNDYYGSGTDTCGATACETGYHVDGGGLELVEKTPLIPVNYKIDGTAYAVIDIDGEYYEAEISDSGLTKNGTWVTEFDYGRVYGKATCQPKADDGLEYLFSNLDTILSGALTIDTVRGELKKMVGPIKADVYINYLNLMAFGDEDISDEEQLEIGKKFFVLSMVPHANYQTTDNGKYCYCQMDGFTSTEGKKTNIMSAPWVFSWGYNTDKQCADACADACAFANIQGNPISRAVMFGALDAVETGGTCAANTINIDWNPDNGGEHTKNMCTYEGEITLPTPDPVKPGYTFTGWKLVE